ncbi:MAG: hypothetical protein LAQ69_18405 [Acidobacteriia bacterium]|nr:hypothetical protein [Terriglobia bacterium]
MNFYEILGDLYVEKREVERVIDQLEELARADRPAAMAVPAESRGRKSMGPAERQQVSARMKKYWAGHRLLRQKLLALGQVRMKLADGRE